MEHGAAQPSIDDELDAAAGPTNDQVVDEALELLDSLEERPLREHVAAFESVHGALQDRLAEGQR